MLRATQLFDIKDTDGLYIGFIMTRLRAYTHPRPDIVFARIGMFVGISEPYWSGRRVRSEFLC